ncbi:MULTISPECIES: hypothetical protein [Streptomyces]|uniref:Uncharacterized protein n=1 Tax=Streptomyces caniscabiei TaxID=2746961 RepID=A0ABU4N1U4_9ACTN|nr:MULTISPECIES: hypothetical protein [Streptomyces]MBE4733327.1 hypothetical protein [Streptomyces caniscabiei]MBE4754505.1 hypothetical protein [Streptomyces caniscabiei]MBE4781822.1 hypothetical protein [Streptomyces caniscabiei]MBE4793112.1 hypothetical protein [Streptomyces caniscabiei]MDX2948458.1 hypothetical protein [Streptomyces caniscabiei]
MAASSAAPQAAADLVTEPPDRGEQGSAPRPSAVVQGILQLSEVGGEGFMVGGREGGVAAGQGLAVGKDRLDAGFGGRAAQGAVGIVDAGDEGPWVHVRVVAGRDAARAGFVVDDLAVEDRVAGELGESASASASAGPASAGRSLSAPISARNWPRGKGFLGFDLVAEPGVAGAQWWSRVSELPQCLRS